MDYLSMQSSNGDLSPIFLKIQILFFSRYIINENKRFQLYMGFLPGEWNSKLEELFKVILAFSLTKRMTSSRPPISDAKPVWRQYIDPVGRNCTCVKNSNYVAFSWPWGLVLCNILYNLLYILRALQKLWRIYCNISILNFKITIALMSGRLKHRTT